MKQMLLVRRISDSDYNTPYGGVLLGRTNTLPVEGCPITYYDKDGNFVATGTTVTSVRSDIRSSKAAPILNDCYRLIAG